jgi:hypothetical protein
MRQTLIPEPTTSVAGDFQIIDLACRRFADYMFS